MAEDKKTLVLGTSENPSRYSFLAIKKLLAYDHPVVAIGRREGKVGTVPIQKSPVQDKNIDTITLYLNPQHQKAYYDYIIGLKPRRIIFNPGTENDELIEMAEKNSIEPIMGCTLVMLSTGEY
jgi:uncharacterized protein